MGYIYNGPQLWYVNSGVCKIINTSDYVPASDILFFQRVYANEITSVTGGPELTDYYVQVGPTGSLGPTGPTGPTGA